MTGNLNSALGGYEPKANEPKAADQITEANAGELEAGRDPVYVAAYDSIRKGAPGLSDATCAVIARSINMKVALSRPAPAALEGSSSGEGEAGREAIWKLVHEVWQLLDDAETDSAGVTTVDQERLQAVSDAMDALEALVPDSEGPFWGGYPVNYLWPKGAAK